MVAAFPTVKLADCVDLLAGFAFKSQHFTDRPDDIPLVKGERSAMAEAGARLM